MSERAEGWGGAQRAVLSSLIRRKVASKCQVTYHCPELCERGPRKKVSVISYLIPWLHVLSQRTDSRDQAQTLQL